MVLVMFNCMVKTLVFYWRRAIWSHGTEVSVKYRTILKYYGGCSKSMVQRGAAQRSVQWETLLYQNMLMGGGHFCCKQPRLWMCKHAKSRQWLRLGSWTNMEVWGVICAPTEGETLTQICRELVLSLCAGNKLLCGAKHSKMAELTWWTEAVRPSTLISNDNMSCGRHYSLQQTRKHAKLRQNSTSHQKCRKLFMTLHVTGK